MKNNLINVENVIVNCRIPFIYFLPLHSITQLFIFNGYETHGFPQPKRSFRCRKWCSTR